MSNFDRAWFQLAHVRRGNIDSRGTAEQRPCDRDGNSIVGGDASMVHSRENHHGTRPVQLQFVAGDGASVRNQVTQYTGVAAMFDYDKFKHFCTSESGVARVRTVIGNSK